ncbi:MAG: hypothetical protein KAI45_07940, partial [Melioribacteraceae bacterium]|nr:hypothetical protein [Melioribacteraceae bacterium]
MGDDIFQWQSLKNHSMKTIVSLFLIISVLGCSNSGQKNKSATKMKTFEKGTYGYDIKFLNEHTKPVEL